MKNLKFSILILFLILFNCFKCNSETEGQKKGNFYIGWASADITPDKPVFIQGLGRARISEEVMDPVTVTAFALESGASGEKAIMISCDLAIIDDGTRSGSDDNLRDNVRKLLKESLPEVKSEQIFLNATHTHAGPLIGPETDLKNLFGIELNAMTPAECLDYISRCIAKAAEKAWKSREPGGISYGLGHAVVGHNRITKNLNGESILYGNPNNENFSHVEGYEDHSVNLLYTWDEQRNLTGVIINVASPSQMTETLHKLSADYWHDTRIEIRQRLGKDIFILPQCSAAGDQSARVVVDKKAEDRMQQLEFPHIEKKLRRRKQIASRIADAVISVLPYMKDNIKWDPAFVHKMEVINLSRRNLEIEDVNKALQEAKDWEEKYKKALNEIEHNPTMKERQPVEDQGAYATPRWYTYITLYYFMMKAQQGVKERYQLQNIQPKIPIEVHVMRIGDIVIATNPFELYLDYGIRIKARSPAVQTFLVQLAGSGTYLPTSRSIEGGAYGSEPRSTLVGPEGGQELVERTLKIINEVME
jgi:hypothetical protein